VWAPESSWELAKEQQRVLLWGAAKAAESAYQEHMTAAERAAASASKAPSWVAAKVEESARQEHTWETSWAMALVLWA